MHIKKRGQLTLFIVVAILIIAILALLFLVAIPNNWFGLKLPESRINPVDSYFNDCFLDKSKDGLTILASKSGYSDLQKLTLAVFYDERAAYYYKDNKTIIPTLNTIQEELANEINKQKEYCFTLPTALKDYEITKTNCTVRTQISKEIKVIFDCPLQIKKGAFSSTLKEKDTYSFNLDYNIPKELNISKAIITEYNSNKPYLCLNCINSIAENNNVFISILPLFNNETSDYTMKESWFLIKEKFDDRNISWRFAIKN